MPPNNTPGEINKTLDRFHDRLTRLENAPQVGNAAILAGSLQVLAPNGLPVVILGYQPDGTVGLGMYNPNTGVKLLQLGQLVAGGAIFGLSVLQSGTMQQVSGAVQAYAAGSITTTGAPVDAFGPSVPVTIGPSGLALVSIGSLISPSVAGVDGDVILTVDGVVLRDGGGAVLVHAVSGAETSVSASALVPGLTPGVRTFALAYTDFGARANMQNRFLIVQPL